MKYILGVIVIIFLTITRVSGQNHFIFLPEVYGKSIDGLGVFKIQNASGSSISGNVVISVHENQTNKDVVTIKTPLISATTGIFNFPSNLYAGSSFSFSSNPLAGIVSQTRNFPPGEYSFCYRFIPDQSHGGDEFDDCFDVVVEPMLPISLISPADSDTFCQTRPVLNWQPPMPFNSSMRFRLLLTEKRQGEAIENLFVNTPLLLLDNIPSTSVNYPSTSPALKEGKTYCWQVIAYQQGVVLSTSEIWQFTVRCNEPAPSNPNDSYRELKVLENGNYYIANRFLKFSYTNNYNIKKLQYAISDLTDGGKVIKNIPEIELHQGLNKIDIDLTTLDLVVGKSYLLKVFAFNEPSIEVRFSYKDEDLNKQSK